MYWKIHIIYSATNNLKQYNKKSKHANEIQNLVNLSANNNSSRETDKL